MISGKGGLSFTFAEGRDLAPLLLRGYSGEKRRGDRTRRRSKREREGGGERQKKEKDGRIAYRFKNPQKGREGGRDWNILKDAFRLNAADEIVSCQGKGRGEQNGKTERDGKNENPREEEKCSREESLENKKKKIITEPVKTYNLSHLHY